MPCFISTRKSFNAAVPEILASNVLTCSDIGLLATLFYITYGLSKFSPVSSATVPTPVILWAGPYRHRRGQYSVWFLHPLWAFALLWALNAFFPYAGSLVCAPSADGPVFANRAKRRLVGIVEYRA